MGDKKKKTLVPESQSAGLWDNVEGKGLVSVLQGGSAEPGGQQGRQSPQSIRAEPLVVDTKGDQHDMEQHSGVWSSAVSAVVWNLPQFYFESDVMHSSGSFW